MMRRLFLYYIDHPDTHGRQGARALADARASGVPSATTSPGMTDRYAMEEYLQVRAGQGVSSRSGGDAS